MAKNNEARSAKKLGTIVSNPEGIPSPSGYQQRNSVEHIVYYQDSVRSLEAADGSIIVITCQSVCKARN